MKVALTTGITGQDGSYLSEFLDSKRIDNIGFTPEINLKEGLIKTYQDYISKLNENI